MHLCCCTKEGTKCRLSFKHQNPQKLLALGLISLLSYTIFHSPQSTTTLFSIHHSLPTSPFLFFQNLNTFVFLFGPQPLLRDQLQVLSHLNLLIHSSSSSSSSPSLGFDCSPPSFSFFPGSASTFVCTYLLNPQKLTN